MQTSEIEDKEEAFFDPPLFLGNDLFKEEDDEDKQQEFAQQYFIRNVEFPNNITFKIREFAFHALNSNFVWPGNLRLATWMLDNWHYFEGKRTLELGSGTGVLALFLKSRGLQVITSDYDDPEIAENISYNCTLNSVEVLPHIPHSWGQKFPEARLKDFDLVVANDIFLYTKEYPNLINTFEQLLSPRADCDPVHCIIGWQRRIEDNKMFFQMMKDKGFTVNTLSSGIFDVYLPSKTKATS